MALALEGVETLFFVSAGRPRTDWNNIGKGVEAAGAAGVERIVYKSFLAAAPDCTFTLGHHHNHTEQFMRNSGSRFVFLRDSLYLDIVPQLVGEGGVIRGPAGAGRVAIVARDDVADSAVTVIADHSHDGMTFDMTGPEAMTWPRLLRP